MNGKTKESKGAKEEGKKKERNEEINIETKKQDMQSEYAKRARSNVEGKSVR